MTGGSNGSAGSAGSAGGGALGANPWAYDMVESRHVGATFEAFDVADTRLYLIQQKPVKNEKFNNNQDNNVDK